MCGGLVGGGVCGEEKKRWVEGRREEEGRKREGGVLRDVDGWACGGGRWAEIEGAAGTHQTCASYNQNKRINPTKPPCISVLGVTHSVSLSNLIGVAESAGMS